jgi:8-oxo-dGTP pyrophosphatase MutT (NUDIX family)
MLRSIDHLPTAGRPRVTVAAIAGQGGKYLFVEERLADGGLVINQPAGHVECDESLLEAVIRETLEETGRQFTPEALVGIYQWGAPMSDRNFLRVCFAGTVGESVAEARLDPDIERALWLSPRELASESGRLRSPLVARCLDDYLAGERYPLSLCKSLLQV